ncbi:tetratricopeptide repeat protein [Moorena producens JHB]|uniref:Tetratricopeptide repeat protein n=1 Tax=Moorena producens (strain JHB) TaxID=1454205 RepID=A0A9Q9SSF0_MOOP1|nr:CHAT domain-containing protein [Moorena producens]WAN68771.1 tetratricopeptide repeat protein [Moorena producens JHB]
MKLKHVLWLGLLTLCLTDGVLPVLARFLSLSVLTQEQNTVSPEQEGTIAPGDAIVQVDSKQAEVDKLFLQGFIHVSRSKFPEALQSWQQALVIYKQIGDRKGEAKSLGNLGFAYYHLGQYKQAIDYYQKSLAIQREIGDHKDEANSLNNLGLAYYHLGDYKKAIDYYQQSLSIKKEIGDREGEPSSLTNLGLAYDNLGDYKKAIDYHQKSLAIAREIGSREGEAYSLNNLGLAYDNLGDYKKAIDYLQKSLAIAREIGHRQGEAYSLNNLGNAYHNLGDYKKAIDYYKNFLVIAREIGYSLGEANSLNNLGSAYQSLGNYQKAIDYLQQSLAIHQEIGDRNGEAASLNNLGNAYSTLGEYKKEINYLQKSLAIAREIGYRQGEASSLANLGNAYHCLGDYKKAIDYYQKSLAIAREIGYRQGEASSLNNLGSAYDTLGEYKKAIDYYQKSLAIDREIGHRQGEAQSLSNLGLNFLKNNQLEQAQTHLFDAIKIWEDIRHLLRNQDDWKVSIFEEQACSYCNLQEVLVAQGQPRLALEISERGRNRALIDLLAAQLSKTPQKTKAPTLKDIQEIAQQQQATLVEYSIVDDQIYIWVIAPTGEITFRSNRLPKDTTLAELVKVSRQQIGVRGRGNQNADSPPNPKDGNRLQELYQLLITPIVDVLPINPSDRVIFIPHQALFLVPFAALQDDDGNYLIENHTILTAPSIQSLWFTRKHWHRVQDSTGKPLIVGNPTMPTIKIGREQEQLTPLPGAETEALSIAQLLKTTAVIGPEATESTIVEKMANASVIHLATHGLLDDVNGIDYPGAIALAPDQPDHDGFLTSREILIGYGLPEKPLLKAKLVVLSACDTGRGEIKGEGVVGLSRSLIAAGVPSLVVSLWQVPDDDTAKLMREFYTNIYTHKFDKAKAMREAMLSMLNDEDGNPDPKAWAAFTVIGEAR